MRLVTFLLAFAAIGFAARGADDLAPVKEDAVRLYDKGSYEEALSTLQQLDAARALDGPMLYRLFFCEKATGHEDDARKVLERAREALEGEVAASHDLESSFYLANSYVNLGRAGDAKAAAHEMTARIESGKSSAPTTAIGLFQVGKLYQDHGRETEATTYYTKAVDGFDVAKGRYAGNVRWALRYLGNAAYARSDFAASDSAFTRLTAAGGAEAADWEALAAARVRLEKYASAAEAWRGSVKADAANADDARYAARLADMAALLTPLPTGPAEGIKFASMTQGDLGSFVKARADAAIAAQTKAAKAMEADEKGAPTQALDPKVRKELAETLKQTRRQFVAGALEYALRHFGVRETAFKEGYAVFIFQDRAWELPQDPKPTTDTAKPKG
jgi:tetratricopeptide (TPR) repeat protein